MTGGRPDYVNLWVRRCTHKIKETMQTYIQEGFETKWKKDEKNTPERSKIEPKIDPKWYENEAKRDKKSNQRLQDDLGGFKGAIFRLSRQIQTPTWSPKSNKKCKKAS